MTAQSVLLNTSADAVAATFELIETQVLALTLELAKEFRAMRGSPTERALNPGRVEHLRQKAFDNRLIPFMWATAELDGRTYRMNGQHSSEMLCTLDGMFPPNGTVFMSKYKVPNKAGLALLFRQFDDRKSGRSTADVAGAYQGLVDELKDIPREKGKTAIDGIAWYMAAVQGLPVARGDDKYDLFNNAGLHPFIHWIADLFTSKTPELEKHPPVIAAMFGTYEANTSEAKRFWDEVARSGDQFDDNAPSTVLDNWLRVNHEKPDPDIKQANVYQGAVFAWNAYRAGKQIPAIRADAKKSFYKIAE